MTKQFYVTIELASIGRIFVATELAMTGSSVAHDRAGRVKAMLARQTMPGVYD